MNAGRLCESVEEILLATSTMEVTEVCVIVVVVHQTTQASGTIEWGEIMGKGKPQQSIGPAVLSERGWELGLHGGSISGRPVKF